MNFSVKPDPAETISMTGIFSHFHSLQTAIQFAEESHKATGQNLANVNTPNYKTKEVPFDQLLARLSQDPGMENRQSFSVEPTSGLQERKDGNNVDLDRELAMLKKNSLAFQTLAQLLGSKMGILQKAISS